MVLRLIQHENQMNIKIKKFFVLYFSLAIVLSVQASRTLRNNSPAPLSEIIISENENINPTRIKRAASPSSPKIENILSNRRFRRSQVQKNEIISNYKGALVDNTDLTGDELISNTQVDLAVQNVH
ncbi:MAG: hypothetical protein DRJ10_17975, partial [Bacteroidetes bacterium]